jgi:5-methyltetrahydrofolate--homocysteine methyltransferase
LAGPFRRFEDEVVGRPCRVCRRHNAAIEAWLTANGVIGLYPANSVGDDIEIYTDGVPH